MQKRYAVLSALLVAFVLSSGVVQAQEIGVVLAGTKGPFWKTVEKGITQAGIDFGVTVSVRSPVDDDPRTVEQNLQIKMVQSLLRAGAKAIILAPMPVRGVPTPVEFPVPVVFVDRPSDDFKALSTIATDNYAAGRAGAASLRGQLGKGGKVGVLRLAPYVVSTTARENGFVDAAKEMGFDVVVDAYLSHDIREAQASAAAALAPQQGRIDAVFTPTDYLALSVLRVLHEWPREKRPQLVGFDYRPGFEDDLRSGDLYAIVVQNPFQMGYRAVQALVQFRSGEQIPKQVAIDVLVVTANNVDDLKSIRH